MIFADVDFPDFGCFLRAEYDINHVQPFARTGMVTGRARQRRTFTSVPSMVNASMIVSGSEAQFFEAWFKYDIDDGGKWFNATLKTPLGVRPYVCRFTEMYSGPTLTGRDRWRFDLKLEIRERPILDENWYRYGEEFIIDASIIDIALNREWPES